MQRSPQAPNASMVLSPLSRSLGVAAKISKSGSFDPGGLLDVSKPPERFVGVQGVSMGVHCDVEDVLRKRMNFPHGFHLELLVLLSDNVLELIRTIPYRVYVQIHLKRPAKGEVAKSHD